MSDELKQVAEIRHENETNVVRHCAIKELIDELCGIATKALEERDSLKRDIALGDKLMAERGERTTHLQSQLGEALEERDENFQMGLRFSEKNVRLKRRPVSYTHLTLPTILLV